MDYRLAGGTPRWFIAKFVESSILNGLSLFR